MPVGRVSGKTALVTGGASGIGAAIASALSGEGANVVIADLNKTAGKRFASSLTNAVFTHHDVTSETDWEACMAETRHCFGSLEILVNNAGTNIPEPFLKVKNSSLETLLNINTKAAFNMSKLCTDKMLKFKNRKKIGGAIIHTSSMFGLVGGPDRTVYSMTKFGLEGLTKGMSIDLAKFNIRVNSVCPTFVATPRAKKYLANKKFNRSAAAGLR